MKNLYICNMYDYNSIYRAFIAGDIALFYEKLYPGLLIYASRQLGENLAYFAEDCVQDAVIKSYKIRNTFTNSAVWYSFILKCIYNSAIDALRKNQSRSIYIESATKDARSHDIDVEMLEQETLDRLQAAVEALPPRYREILRLSFAEGLKNSEIAARLGVAEITVKKHKARILMMLRETLGNNYPIEVIIFMLSYSLDAFPAKIVG